MSHWANIQTQIKDIEALAHACAELGVKLIADSTARGYGKQTMKADYVIRLPGPYDVALAKQPDGTFTLTTDWWGGSVEAVVGKNYARLKQLYAVHKATLEAKKKGHTVVRTQKDGAIRLTVNMPG